MIPPNYKNNSIVNLMSSIARARKGKTPYNPLKLLPPEKIKDSKNIVLLVIDGLGYEYLKNKKFSVLNHYLKGKMTSVFPPTTAAAIPTFMTGVAPQQHASTGWHMYLDEIGIVGTILPFVSRTGGKPKKLNIDIKKILTEKSFTQRIKAKSFVIQPSEVAYSEFSRLMSKNAKILGYRNLNGFFNQIKKSIKSSNKSKYIYAYWPELDRLNHTHGESSKKSEKHLKQFDKKLKIFIKSLKSTNTTLIITGDHGFMNTPNEKKIWLENHPKLEKYLDQPFSGEPRTVYCYVNPKKSKDFEKYIKQNLSDYCYLFKSKDLIKKNYFGLGKPNPKLLNRVGNYTLILKDNYILKDLLAGEKKKNKKGYHGGISKQEMFVPLIVIKA